MDSCPADHCTAAVTCDGSLYTWGDGAAQNLGYADTLRQVIPRRVELGNGQHVLQVCLPRPRQRVLNSWLNQQAALCLVKVGC